MTKSLFSQRDGSVAAQAMLGGLARCAGCGHTLKITGNTEQEDGRALSRLLLHRPLRQRPLSRARKRSRLSSR